MKKILLFTCFALLCLCGYSQSMTSYKTKNATNAKDRTAMLDLLRTKLTQVHKQDFVFVVDVFNVSGGYAWLKATAQRKDGAQISLSDDYDCCHVEALFKKNSTTWTLVESGAFSTDVWYDGIWNRVNAPKIIFGEDYHE